MFIKPQLWMRLLPLVIFISACGGMPTQNDGAGDYESGLELMKKKKYPEAIAVFEQVIGKNDRYAGAYVNMGIAYGQLGKQEEAQTAFEAAIRKNPDNAVAYNELGIVYRQTGQFDKAKTAYQKSIANKRNYSKAYLNLGILCDIYLLDLPCAIKNYEKYLTLTKEGDKQVSLWIADLKKRSQ